MRNVFWKDLLKRCLNITWISSESESEDLNFYASHLEEKLNAGEISRRDLLKIVLTFGSAVGMAVGFPRTVEAFSGARLRRAKISDADLYQFNPLTPYYQNSFDKIRVFYFKNNLCFLKRDKSLWITETGTPATPAVLIGNPGDRWASASGGYFGNFLIKDDGTYWYTGDNKFADAGFGIAASGYSTPVQIGTETDWKDVATGNNATLIRKTDNTLWSCGKNTSGSLGTGLSTSLSYPLSPVLGMGAVSHYSIYDAGFAVRASDSTLWGWGLNSNYQLGNGLTVSVSTPIQLGSATNWSKVSTLSSLSFGVRTDGTLWVWGRSVGWSFGIGLNNTTQIRSTPVQVPGTNWSKVLPISHIQTSCYGIQTDGTLWAWGGGTTGRLGIGSTANVSTPVRVGTDTKWVDIRDNNLGGIFGLKSDNTLWAWGNNTNSSLGLGDSVNRSTPVQIGTDTDWVKLFPSLALKSNGTAHVWGERGWRGCGTYVTRSTPVQMGSATNWSEHAVNGFLIKTDGTLWGFGGFYYHNLSFFYDTAYPNLTQVGTDTNWKKICGTYSLTWGLKKNGTLWAWGRQEIAEGQDQSFFPSSRLEILSPTHIVTGLTWTDISVNQYDVAIGICSDGTLWSLRNSVMTVNLESPNMIDSATDWAVVATSDEHIVAIKSNGTLWAMGYNSNGKLGLGDTVARSSFVQVGSDTDWSKVSVNSTKTYAIKKNQTLWIWGAGVSVPTQYGTNTGWTDICTDWWQEAALTRKTP